MRRDSKRCASSSACRRCYLSPCALPRQLQTPTTTHASTSSRSAGSWQWPSSHALPLASSKLPNHHDFRIICTFVSEPRGCMYKKVEYMKACFPRAAYGACPHTWLLKLKLASPARGSTLLNSQIHARPYMYLYIWGRPIRDSRGTLRYIEGRLT